MSKYAPLLKYLPYVYPQSIAQIVWTVEGIKPVSSASFRAPISEETLKSLFSLLTRFGLYVARHNDCARAEHPVVGFVVAARHSDAKAVMNDGRTETRDLWPAMWAAHGKLYGFPQTAIDGFVSRKTLRKRELLAEVLSIEEMRAYEQITPFAFSQDHWREEAVTLQQWLDVLKKAFPDFYEILQVLSPRAEAI